MKNLKIEIKNVIEELKIPFIVQSITFLLITIISHISVVFFNSNSFPWVVYPIVLGILISSFVIYFIVLFAFKYFKKGFKLLSRKFQNNEK